MNDDLNKKYISEIEKNQKMFEKKITKFKKYKNNPIYNENVDDDFDNDEEDIPKKMPKNREIRLIKKENNISDDEEKVENKKNFRKKIENRRKNEEKFEENKKWEQKDEGIMNELKEKLKNKEEEIKNLKNKLDNLYENNKKLKTTIKEKNNEIDNLKIELDSNKEDINNSNNKFDNIINKYKKLVKDYDDLNKNNSNLKLEKENMKSIIEEQKAELFNNKKEINELKKYINILKNQQQLSFEINEDFQNTHLKNNKTKNLQNYKILIEDEEEQIIKKKEQPPPPEISKNENNAIIIEKGKIIGCDRNEMQNLIDNREYEKVDKELSILIKEKNRLEGDLLKMPEHPRKLNDIRNKKDINDTIQKIENDISYIRIKLKQTNDYYIKKI